jgi:hypothetical protein
MTMPNAPHSRRKLWALAAGLLALPIVALGLYTLAALGWSYSDGERAGVLQKFSHKGWICKTYEGELALYVVPGVAPTIWEFTVRDPAVAEGLNAALGKHVSLHYEEHRGLPTSCLGQTAYFVDGVRVVR